MNLDTANKILQETEAGYDLMAEKFSETRKYFWRGLEFIRDYAKDGDRILDFGCGNGRLLELFTGKNIEYAGVDVSQKLVDLAGQKYRDKNIKFLKIDGYNTLPFPDNYFNAIYSIAVFHHIPSRELRKKMAQELYRVTGSGGYIVVTVWNLWQKKYLKNLIKNWINKIFGKSKLDWNDCYVSFKNNQGEIFQRYHHAWRAGELAQAFQKAGFTIERCEVIHPGSKVEATCYGASIGNKTKLAMGQAGWKKLSTGGNIVLLGRKTA